MPHTRITPLSFTLGNSINNESTLVTLNQGDDGQALNWTVHNKTLGDIQVPQGSGDASASNYHFAICLPPDLLASLDEIEIAPMSGWSMSAPITNGQGDDCLYVLRTGNTYSLPHDHDVADALQFVVRKIFVADHKAWSPTTVRIKSRGLLLAGTPLPPARQQVLLTILHTISVDLSDLEGVNSLDGLKEEIKVLRNQTVPPLQVRILDSWNMLAPHSWRELELEISVNHDFFKNEDAPYVGVLDTSARITIDPLVTTAGSDISVHIAEGQPWNDDESTADQVVLRPNLATVIVDDDENKLNILLDLRTGALSMPSLKLECTGFTGMGEAGPDGEGVGAFTIEIPLMVGPLEASAASGEPRLGVFGNSGHPGVEPIFEVRHSPDANSRHLAMGVQAEDGGLKRTWIESREAPLYINTNGQHLILQRNRRANVGIGLVDPERLLDVNGNARFEGVVLIDGNLEVAGRITAGGKSAFGTTSDGEHIYWGIIQEHAGFDPFPVLKHTLESELTTLSGSEIVFATPDNDESLTISRNGNVTIGLGGADANSTSALTLKAELNNGPKTILDISGRDHVTGNYQKLEVGLRGPHTDEDRPTLENGYSWLQSSGPLVVNEQASQALFINPRGGVNSSVLIGTTERLGQASLVVNGDVVADSWFLPEQGNFSASTRITAREIAVTHRRGFDRTTVRIAPDRISIGNEELTVEGIRVLQALANGTLEFRIRNRDRNLSNDFGKAEFVHNSDDRTVMRLEIKDI